MIARAKAIADIHAFIAHEIEQGRELYHDEVAGLFLASRHVEAYADLTPSDLEPFAEEALAAYAAPPLTAAEAEQHAAELRAYVEARRRQRN